MKNNCIKCNKNYETESGLYKHNRTYHPKLLVRENKTDQSNCNFCNKKLSNYISKWRHEKICKFNKKTFEPNEKIGLIKDIQEEILSLNAMVKKSFGGTLLNKISNLSHEIKKLKNKPTTINIHKTEITPVNSNSITLTEVFKINNIEVKIYKNYYFDANEICGLCNKQFTDWINIKTTNDIISEINKLTNILINDLIIKNDDNLLIHPYVASQLFQWLNPIYGIIFNNWLIEKKINEKNEEIKLLINNFVKKHVRTEYTDDNVVYLLTTKFHKENRIYIVGKAEDLAGRLSTYNKTCEHEVVYYKSCGKKEFLNIIENMVLKKLNPYREVANRDRFVLPPGKEISFFTDIIDQSINFFNDVSSDSESSISDESDDSGYQLKTTKVKAKPINKAKAISKIQKLLDEIAGFSN